MIRFLVNVLETLLNTFYRQRLYPRFYVLETVARVPYFAYTSVLHMVRNNGLVAQIRLVESSLFRVLERTASLI